MFIIDRIAHGNALKKTNPLEKVSFALFTLLISLFSPHALSSLSIIVLVCSILIFRARVSPRRLFELLMLPSAFIVTGLAAIILHISPARTEGIVLLHHGGFWVMLSNQGLHQGLSLFLKSISSVCCLYFLVLTTPVIDLASVFKKLRVPGFLTELFCLVYRGIFIFYEIAGHMILSQGSRLGYSSVRNSLNSCAHLTSSLFVKSQIYSQNVYLSLLSRGYEGEMKALEPPYTTSLSNWLFIVIAELFLCAIAVWGRKILG